MMDALIPATEVLCTNEGTLTDAVAAAEKVPRSLNPIAIHRINECS